MDKSYFWNLVYVHTVSVCGVTQVCLFKADGHSVREIYLVSEQHTMRYTSNVCACFSPREQTYLITLTADKVILRLGLIPPPTFALNLIISHLHLLLVTLALPSFGWVRLGWESEHLLLQSELGLEPLITLPAAADLQVTRQTWTDRAGERLCWCGSISWTFLGRSAATLF